MTLFSTITKGMADGAETLQANFAKLATAITSIGDDGTMTVPKLNVDNLAVSGDAPWTVLTSNVSGYSIQYKVVNNEVSIKVNGTATLASTNTVLAQLPEAIRPYPSSIDSLVYTYNSGFKIHVLTASVGGDLKLGASSLTDVNGKAVNFNIQYQL